MRTHLVSALAVRRAASVLVLEEALDCLDDASLLCLGQFFMHGNFSDRAKAAPSPDIPDPTTAIFIL